MVSTVLVRPSVTAPPDCVNVAGVLRPMLMNPAVVLVSANEPPWSAYDAEPEYVVEALGLLPRTRLLVLLTSPPS